MGMFDDAMKNAVPGGNLATPIAVAAGALILGKILGGRSAPPQRRRPSRRIRRLARRSLRPEPRRAAFSAVSRDLIGKLTAGGAAPQVNSWVGHGPEPADPARPARRRARSERRSTNCRSAPA